MSHIPPGMIEQQHVPVPDVWRQYMCTLNSEKPAIQMLCICMQLWQ